MFKSNSNLKEITLTELPFYAKNKDTSEFKSFRGLIIYI